MYCQILKSKIHNVKVTKTALDYVGSITIDKNWVDAAGLLPGEKVLVVNNNNGERIETYVIVGEAGSGIICLNGAAARRFQVKDEIIVMAFGSMEYNKELAFEPMVIFPQEDKSWMNMDEMIEFVLLVHGLEKFQEDYKAKSLRTLEKGKIIEFDINMNKLVASVALEMGVSPNRVENIAISFLSKK